MLIVDIIARKRDGLRLTRDEIGLFIAGVSSGDCPDYQVAALLMAIVLRGMAPEEIQWLTEAVAQSGERLDLSDVAGAKIGKHSTGGVGDKLTLIAAPLAAACGVVVPKMSGRGLGHTGGTLDKLEAIPGMRLDLSTENFKSVLRHAGTCIVGQTASLAPADKRLYALRDVTATLSSVALIAASVMGKKLAEGLDGLVLDVKCGSGAFMKTQAEAQVLADTMVAIGTRAGLPCEALVTDMATPLGRAVGNALEVAEAVAVLAGEGPSDVTELAVALATRMVALAGVPDEPERRVRAALASGHGLERLRLMVEGQGGDPRVIDDVRRLPGAAHRERVTADRPGHVAGVDAELVGRAARALGAGRGRLGDEVDHGAGILVTRVPGEPVREGDTVLELLFNDPGVLAEALPLARAAVVIADEAPPPRPRLLDRVAGGRG